MLEMDNTNINNITTKTEKYQKGNWINMVEPTEGERSEVCKNLNINGDFIRYALDYEEKARIDMEDDGTIPHIHLFMTDFNAKVINNKTDVEFNYSKDVLNKKKYSHLKFYLKNIGNADINQLDICATAQKNTMLCHVDDIKVFTENKLVNYSYLFDRKIIKEKAVMIDIAYLPDSKICNTFSSELVLIFRDSYGNLYEQPFFLQQKNLYEPRSITHKEYNIYTKPDTAIECFKNPWLW